MARQSNQRQDRRSHSPLPVQTAQIGRPTRLISVSAPPSVTVELEVIQTNRGTPGTQASLTQYFPTTNQARSGGAHPYAQRRNDNSLPELRPGGSAQHRGFMTSGNREVGPQRQDSQRQDSDGEGRPSKDRLDEAVFSRNPVRAARAFIAEETIKIISETEVSSSTLSQSESHFTQFLGI